MNEPLQALRAQSLMVGREQESALLAAAIDACARGEGACILVEGPAGIGKSRLAREAEAIANSRGFMSLVGVCCQEDRGTAFAPIIDGLRDASLRDPGAKRAAARRLQDLLVGAASGRVDDASSAGQGERARIIDALLQFVDDVPDGQGCLVIVEDVHWADHATVRILAAISRHARDRRLVLVLTYRDDEIERSDALAGLLQALSSSTANVETLRLRPLTWSETRTMAKSVLGIDRLPPTALVDSLYARTEGNPFFSQEILRALPVHDFARPLELRIPEQLPVTITRLLEHRIKQLPEGAASVLASAAVLGRRFDQTTLRDVGDFPERTLVSALHEGIDAHLIRDIGDGRTIEFQHALIREAAEGLLLSSERKELHQRIARYLDTNPGLGDSAAIAVHYAQAGLPDGVARHAVKSADHAWRAGAPVEAAHWYEQALSASAACGSDVPESVLRRAADAFAAARLHQLASDAFERLLQAQRARGDVLAEGETLGEYATLFTADFTRWSEMLEQARTILEPLGETAALARVYARLASHYVLTSNARGAIDAGRKARDIAKNTGAIDAEAVGRRALGIIVAAGGDLAAGARFLERSIELAKSANRHTDVYLSSLGLVDSAIRANDWTLAENTVRESIAYARRLGSGMEAGSLMARLADLLRFTGRVAEAQDTIDKALVLIDEDEAYLFVAALLVKADVLADLGLWNAVREQLEAVMTTAERSGQFHIHGGALFLLARAARGEGNTSLAAEIVSRALALWRETQDNYYCLPMLLFACRLACESRDLATARKLIAELHRVHARTPLCGATIPAAEAFLAAAEGRADDAILLWRESVASFEDLGRRVDASRARLEFGRALLSRRGAEDRDEARRQLLIVQMEAPGLPESADADALLRRHRLIAAQSGRDDSPLTAREREIVELIARGLTNRGMATELTLSARTIDNHVSRILAKLELASRAQIVAYAIERGITRAKTVK